MNKLACILPVAMLVYSWWLRYIEDLLFSWVCFVVAVFMWLALFGNHLNNNKNQMT